MVLSQLSRGVEWQLLIKVIEDWNVTFLPRRLKLIMWQLLIKVIEDWNLYYVMQPGGRHNSDNY